MNREVKMGATRGDIGPLVAVRCSERRSCDSGPLVAVRCSDRRSCVDRGVGLGSHSLSHSSPVPNKPYGFCGHRAP